VSWLNGADGTPLVDLDDVLALRPVATAQLRDLEAELGNSALDERTVELVRARVARLLGLRDAPIVDDATLSDRERAALGFAEQYVLDPSGITDDHAAALHDVLSEPELTALTFCVAVYDALGRIELVLGEAR
jgi:alkylhydroperoxidase family enzyme